MRCPSCKVGGGRWDGVTPLHRNKQYYLHTPGITHEPMTTTTTPHPWTPCIPPWTGIAIPTRVCRNILDMPYCNTWNWYGLSLARQFAASFFLSINKDGIAIPRRNLVPVAMDWHRFVRPMSITWYGRRSMHDTTPRSGPMIVQRANLCYHGYRYCSSTKIAVFSIVTNKHGTIANACNRGMFRTQCRNHGSAAALALRAHGCIPGHPRAREA